MKYIYRRVVKYVTDTTTKILAKYCMLEALELGGVEGWTFYNISLTAYKKFYYPQEKDETKEAYLERLKTITFEDLAHKRFDKLQQKEAE